MKLYFLLFLFMISYYAGISQSKVNALQHLLFFKPGVPTHPYRVNELQYHKGFIIKNSGDTLWGSIKLKGDNPKSISFRLNSTDKESINYDDSIIKQVRLFASDTLLLSSSYTDFEKVPGMGSQLLRKLFDGKVVLYDGYLLCGENDGAVDLDGMIIKKDNKAMFVTSFWDTSSKKALIKKINLYCGTSLKNRQFSDIPTLLKWLRNHLS